ncbi:hypothetical protein QC764_102700 [Podospora pseudoanserina]|uniref:Uncharacterized protein n=1 Tax=Podospora pseudoanserina TaxID=2609844 RepID=A0ABR0IM65_9PEZI|nr:hypothetical protein QC764_102700 [Podospora pseudoanserina]
MLGQSRKPHQGRRTQIAHSCAALYFLGGDRGETPLQCNRVAFHCLCRPLENQHPPPKAHPLQQMGQGLTAWGQLPLVPNTGEGLPHVCTDDSISSLGNRPTTNTTPLIGIWEAHLAYCRLVLPAERHVHFSLHVAPSRLEPPVESLSPAAFHHGIIRHSRRGCDPGEDLRCSPAHHPRDSQRFPPSRPPQGHGR